MNQTPWIVATADGVVINIRVVPRASCNEVSGLQGDALKVRLQAPPVEGKANQALARFLAEALHIRPNQVRILAGETGRNKRVLIAGVAEATVRALSETLS
jgi:uncharacterized protein